MTQKDKIKKDYIFSASESLLLLILLIVIFIAKPCLSPAGYKILVTLTVFCLMVDRLR